LSTVISKQQNQALAQSYVQTIKSRNLVLDLGNGVKTNAQLTYPAVGKGPFPGVLLVHGAGRVDMNYGGMFWQIAQYLSERGFAVLRYDKRGIGENGTIINNSVWGNMTYNELVQDAQKALNVLIRQPEVNPNKISIIGHSEGGETVTRIAIDNPATKIKNIVLLDARIQDAYDSVHSQFVGLPLEYAKEVLDKNHTGSISIQKAVKDPIFGQYIAFSLAGNQSYSTSATTTNSTDLGALSSILFSEKSNGSNTTTRQGAGSSAVGLINIDKQLKPMLERTFESAIKATIREIHSKCETPTLCPTYVRSLLNLNSTLSIIGNVSSSTGILMLHGQNDSGSAVQQAFLLQQRLTELNHPDHTLITYPNLGHTLYPSSQWQTSSGPVPSYVLADLYAWLESHSGLSHTYTIIPEFLQSSSIEKIIHPRAA
jgi:pimeloyl-ACP methyl ester carboxylesterase